VIAAGLCGRLGASWLSSDARALGGALDAVLDIY
jgi:hypothetical protein